MLKVYACGIYVKKHKINISLKESSQDTKKTLIFVKFSAKSDNKKDFFNTFAYIKLIF